MQIRCVAGLGNPGSRYEWTRHNAGFWVVDRIAHEARLRWARFDDSERARGLVYQREVLFLKPQTYMNRSGDAVSRCLRSEGWMPEELLVVVDDATLPLGRVRLRTGGSSGGHRGLESVEESIETMSYPRLRLGVGPAGDGEDLAEYLLRPIEEIEVESFRTLAGKGAEAVRDVLQEGLDWAMNRHNPIPPEVQHPPAESSTG